MTQHLLLPVLGLSLTLGCSASDDKAQADQPDVFNADTTTDTASDPSTDTGTDSDTDDGADTAADTSADTGTDTGAEDLPDLAIDGVYEGEISVTLLADPLGTGVMIEETCTGTLVVNVMQVGDPPIYGDGQCSIPETGIMALLIGSAGPFDGRTSGMVAEDDTATGAIVLDLPGVESEVSVDWTGRFEGVDGTPHFTGECDGTIADLRVEMDTGPLIFDVSYSGSFEMVQTRTP